MLFKRFLSGGALTGAGCLIVLLIAAAAVAVNAALVGLVWNGLDARGIFDAGTLSMWQCVGVGILIGIFTGG